MKKNFTLILSVLLLTTAISAQVYIPNFTISDTNGNSYDLYDELENNKTIVLDFFALQCGSCQTGIAYAENIFQTYGSNTLVFAIETSGGDNFEIQDFIQSNGGTFPGFSFNDNDTLNSFFEITYTPQYFVICSDKQIKSCTAEQLIDYVEGCQIANSVYGVNNNPVSAINKISTTNEIEIYFSSNSNNKISFDLYDLLGNKLAQNSDYYQQGTNKLSISKSGLSKGYYFIRMFEADKYISSKKFTIQ